LRDLGHFSLPTAEEEADLDIAAEAAQAKAHGIAGRVNTLTVRCDTCTMAQPSEGVFSQLS
jgi:hypothetical protein